jgi:hypothetical protein
MANRPKKIRQDAKILASQRRKSDGTPFVAKTKVNLNPFNKADVPHDEYINNYSVKHSNAPKRAKEFHEARKGQSLQNRLDIITNMDKDYQEAKTWKSANPNYVYPGGTGDRK